MKGLEVLKTDAIEKPQAVCIAIESAVIYVRFLCKSAVQGQMLDWLRYRQNLIEMCADHQSIDDVVKRYAGESATPKFSAVPLASSNALLGSRQDVSVGSFVRLV